MKTYIHILSVSVFSMLLFFNITNAYAEDGDQMPSHSRKQTFPLLMAQANNNTNNESSAEVLLQSLAEKEKRRRKIAGYTLLGIGPLIVLAEASSDKSDAFGYVVGGLAAVGGIASLISPGLAEQEHLKLQRSSDPEEREKAAYESLVTLAHGGRIWRYMNAAVTAGLCAYFTSEENYLGTGAFGALTAYSLLSKSLREKALEKYNQGHKSATQAQVFAFINKHDGLNVVLSMPF